MVPGPNAIKNMGTHGQPAAWGLCPKTGISSLLRRYYVATEAIEFLRMKTDL